MSDDKLHDDMWIIQQSITPGFNSLKTTGTEKLLVVLFVVDCSRTMDGERIQAVNAALREVKATLQDFKAEQGLNLKIAIMSFTSNVHWDLQLTDIDEVILENLTTRPGLTEYGAAFHELNKVLQKDGFMKYTGNIAPPAIMFLTDGEPTDDYQADLDDLLKNNYFANASRSAILLGDAISNQAARNAVSSFVDNLEDIVNAEDSSVIIQKIKLATMHTIAGNPLAENNTIEDPLKSNEDPFKDEEDPFKDNEDPFKDEEDPFKDNEDPFKDNEDPFKDDEDPFKDDEDPFKDDEDPFKDGEDPFKDDEDPFKDEEDSFKDDEDPFKDDEDPFLGGESRPAR